MLGARSVLDVPCGDFNWMRHVEWDVRRYVGGDIVPELIARNRALYASETKEFRAMNLVTDTPESFDLVIVRDLFIHLPLNAIGRALRNVAQSRSFHLLTTTFPRILENTDIEYGGYRPINLELPPFSFPAPKYTIDDWNYLGGPPDVLSPPHESVVRPSGEPWGRCLALWSIEDLAVILTTQ
jgi:hypothetical protein